MLRCSNGHEMPAALTCQKCGAKALFRAALPDLMTLPPLEARFEETAVLFVGERPGSLPEAYSPEVVVGRGHSTAKRFMAPKLEGGTWLDYNAKYSDTFSSWLRLVEFARSRYRVAVLDSTNPLSVLAVNNIPSPENTVLLASYPGKSSTPIAQNTSYAALQVGRRRGMHVVLGSDSYVDQLAAFVEGKGLSSGEEAYEHVISCFVSFLPDIVDLVQKDARLGIGVHYFSVLLSASDKVFKSVDEALNVQLTENSLGGSFEKVFTTHLLAAAVPEAQKPIAAAFARLCERQGQSLMNAEVRFRDKKTSYGLYDLFVLFGVKEPSVFDDLRKGYQVIASSAPDLSLEGGLVPPPYMPTEPGVPEADEEQEAAKPGEPKQAATMKEFLQARGEVIDLWLRLRADPRDAILKFSAEVPPDKQPFEGLTEAYRDWLGGAFDEFVSSLAKEDGLTDEVVEKLSALAYCIGSVQDSIYTGDAAARKRGLDALGELGVDRLRIEGLSELDASNLLLKGAEATLKKVLKAETNSK